jgi:hypothetical protein
LLIQNGVHIYTKPPLLRLYSSLNEITVVKTVDGGLADMPGRDEFCQPFWFAFLQRLIFATSQDCANLLAHSEKG